LRVIWIRDPNGQMRTHGTPHRPSTTDQRIAGTPHLSRNEALHLPLRFAEEVCAVVSCELL